MANILLVDDQPYMEELLADELPGMGHTLRWIGKGDALVVELAETHPDLVLLDLFMDGFEGLALLDQIKRHDRRIPVIILTACDSFPNDPRLHLAQGYVTKDLKTDQLRKKITEVLASSNAETSHQGHHHLTSASPV
jgi:two-component system response regulator (stage 0 sporulation protein F)